MSTAVLEVGNVLNQLLSNAGISEAKLGRIIGVPRATINRIASGRTPDPRASTLHAIAKYFNVTVDQLLGNQPIFQHTGSSILTGSYTSIPIIEWDNVNNWNRILQSVKPDNHFDWILTDPNIEVGQFALRVKGDSMWPQFQENTILIVDPTREQKNRDFVVVHIKKSNEILFRQLIIDGKYKFIKAINDIFPTIQLQDADKIIGVVIQTRNNLT
ncbi:MAG: hypothetical protein A3I77_02890 [Gammaproteobacteria bacterium RIFCSPLOWO2_02_FULL_42_14]|nr:MAG: hypothetical protein A3B71_08275 [Gammaproteobacteria bacterium RIFCSPHIGHO2_02_FULL_42_43]OGT29522.1 MAG: hypothetical protein A2624_06255 [Gammaproteobacteria bacterium RIFCSPHIGHO2_01_FULL_42_8]OGT52408.1 MAG: hypothetical protein A3E54_02150 [Gammaproteobacteria bacterium RIFCSPHIGHO2_12_FULL_41_25]OGT62464.1 MAG: hypothetical protein A3I77_02890 [Gammaproteobacteria bacterium RIFCSPLOWO2_02_FULL_42_14]OGT86268.1 MAG: hypothetical protein A3G86_07005 [Gammaproteobacteria bacterium R